MTILWLVTLPEHNGANMKISVSEFKDALQRDDAKVMPFETPTLAIGTLDSLMALTDDLVKINIQVEVINFYIFKFQE